MSTVHLHHVLGHRSVIMVGSGAEGGEDLEEVDEGLIDEEEEVRNQLIITCNTSTGHGSPNIRIHIVCWCLNNSDFDSFSTITV